MVILAIFSYVLTTGFAGFHEADKHDDAAVVAAAKLSEQTIGIYYSGDDERMADGEKRLQIR